MSGELYGTYGTQTQGGPKSWTSEDFELYYERAKGMKMCPPDWSKKDEQKLLGVPRWPRPCFGALCGTHRDEEHLVLRSMAESWGSWGFLGDPRNPGDLATPVGSTVSLFTASWFFLCRRSFCTAPFAEAPLLHSSFCSACNLMLVIVVPVEWNLVSTIASVPMPAFCTA
eukprot:gene8088-1331_t